MTAHSEQRRGPDRRKAARGGRRAGDKPGFAPLVLVAAEDAESRALCETILAKLHFAVAPVESIQRAIAVSGTLHPDVIVVYSRDRAAVPNTGWPNGVPFVTIGDEVRDPDALVEAIRRAIRGSRLS